MASTVYLPSAKAVRAAIAPMTMIIVVRGYAAMPGKSVVVSNVAVMRVVPAPAVKRATRASTFVPIV